MGVCTAAVVFVLFIQATRGDGYLDVGVNGTQQVYNSRPGDVLDTVEHSKIDNALQDVLDSSDLFDFNAVAIGVASLEGTLKNPKFTLEDGVVDSTLPPDILSQQTGLLLFTKSTLGVKGVYGVITYDIVNTELKLAIMFSVPFNRLLYLNKYNIKIYPNTVPVNRDLVEQMYEYAGPWIAKGYEERTEFGIKIRGTMTDHHHSKMIVWVDTSGFDMRLGPARHADCEFKVTSLGYRCWRECTPTGWCWTKVRCDSQADCHGNMHCIAVCEKV